MGNIDQLYQISFLAAAIGTIISLIGVVTYLWKKSNSKIQPITHKDPPSLRYVPGRDDPENKESDWKKQRNRIYDTNRGIFIAHYLKPTKIPGQFYDISIYLIRHRGYESSQNQFEDVSHAEFFLGRYWGNKVFRESEKGGHIGMETSAYGAFLCLCKVTFTDGEVVEMHRYIDFEMGRYINPDT